jgi:glucose-1-phosphatase
VPGAQIDAVVFDLGGVLADFGGVESMRELAGIDSDEEVWRRWLQCRWVRSFERGGCSAEDFAAGVVADWGLPVTPTLFLEQFSSWVVAPMAGAAELLRAVKVTRPIACLSNTNVLHWDGCASRWEIAGLFDYEFLSFRIGLVKPDPEVFDLVARTVDAAPARLVFLDDNDINVASARTLGMQAFRVSGVHEARQALAGLGVI